MVICCMKIDVNKYEISINCFNDIKFDVGLIKKYCNSIFCDFDWDIEEELVVSNLFFN